MMQDIDLTGALSTVVLVFTLALALALLIERFLELLKAAYDMLESQILDPAGRSACLEAGPEGTNANLREASPCGGSPAAGERAADGRAHGERWGCSRG